MPTRLNRREVFLYTWLVAATGLLAIAGRMLWQTARPRVAPGQFGGLFELDSLAALPAAEGPPLHVPEGRFWLVNTPEGLLALDKVCPHLDCLLDWDEQARTFICPCHGSQFAADGAYISGPAPRAMDRFVVQIVDEDGTPLATTKPVEGRPAALAGGVAPMPTRTPQPAEDEDTVPAALRIQVDTGQEIQGASAL